MPGIDIQPQAAWRQIGRDASLTLHRDLARAYLSAEDDELGRLIHDFQNRLHNLLLRHEIMIKLSLIEQGDLPKPLPDRTAAISYNDSG